MTQDSTAPQDLPEREDAPETGDVTGGQADQPGSTDPTEPTVTPEQDDPDREGEDRFDAG